MRKIVVVAALTLMTAAALPSAAHAGTRWLSVGTGFRVGPSHLSFVFGTPGPWLRPSYFVRFDRPIAYSGHHCTSACFREAGYYYHDASCPVAVAHYHRYGYDPGRVYSRYAPYVDGYAYGYGRGYGYDPGYRSRGRVTYYGGHDRGYRDHDGRYDRRNDRGYRDHDGRYDRRQDHRGDRDHGRFDRDRGDRGGRGRDWGRNDRGRGRDDHRGGRDPRDRGHDSGRRQR